MNKKIKQRTKRTLFSIIVAAPPKFDVAHAGPVTGRTSEAMELVCEAVGDDHIRQVEIWKSFMFSGPRNSSLCQNDFEKVDAAISQIGNIAAVTCLAAVAHAGL